MSKKTKKIISTIVNILISIFVIFSVMMTICVFTSLNSTDGLPNIFGKSIVNVLSDSMLPTFKTGDLLVVDRLTADQKTNLQKGDVITYYVDLNGDGVDDVNTHRIVERQENNGVVTYITRGDNPKILVNDDPITSSRVLGKYTNVKLPGMGTVIQFLQTSTGFLIVIVLPLVIFFLYELINFVLLVKKASGKTKLTAEQEDEIKKKAVEEYLRQQQAEAEKAVKPEESTLPEDKQPEDQTKDQPENKE